MRTSRLLVTLLMVIASVGLCSCGEDSLEYVISQPTPDNSYGAPIDKLFSEYMDDYSDIKCRYAFEGNASVFLSGMKNKHLWFNEYDSSTKRLKLSWEDIEETDTIQQVHTGYGEYKEMKIEHAVLIYHQKTEPGSIVAFALFGSEAKFNQFIFTSNGRSKRIPQFGGNTFPQEWYNESIFIDRTCYSNTGEIIFSIDEGSYLNLKDIEPLSYEEGIRFEHSDFSGVSFERLNIKENKSVWETNFRDIKLPSNAKVSDSILDKSSNIWKYKLDVVLYDGTKQSYIFMVNIEDGKVNVAEEGIKVTGVTLNKSQVLLDLGDTFQLVDTVKPNYAENNKVVWTSSNESVATVDQNGLVTAKSYGEAMITVTTEDGGFSATADVTVKAREISDYIASKLNVGVVNLGGYIQCAINCELVNDSKDDVELTSYTILDENEKILLTKSYDHTVLGAKSSYSEGAHVNGTFSELILRWTYVHKGKEYTYTTRYKVKNS